MVGSTEAWCSVSHFTCFFFWGGGVPGLKLPFTHPEVHHLLVIPVQTTLLYTPPPAALSFSQGIADHTAGPECPGPADAQEFYPGECPYVATLGSWIEPLDGCKDPNPNLGCVLVCTVEPVSSADLNSGFDSA